MKKVLFGLFAVAGMLAATSCSNDEDLNGSNGKPTTVSFNVNVDEVAQTRSISDGLTANILYYEVYDEAGTTLVKEGTAEVANLTANFDVDLVTGNSYNVLFWAQNSACTAYNTEDLKNVTVSYDNVLNNNENMDAFCANTTLTVDASNLKQNVTLTRPFAQVNVGVLKENAEQYGITRSSVTVTGYYSSINLLTGAVGDFNPGEVTFQMNAVPTEDLTVENNAYAYLSTTYLLASTDKETVGLDFSFEGTNNYTLEYDNTPIQRNYRTNILTNQGMDKVNFTITIDPAYSGNYGGDGDLNQVENLISVTGIQATYNAEEELIDFSANYSGIAKDDIATAYFVVTPLAPAGIRTRAAEPVKVQATVGESTLTVTGYDASNLNATGNFSVAVEINPTDGDAFTSSAVGTPDAPAFNIPEAGGGEEPGGETVTYTASWQNYGKNGPNSNYAGTGDMEMDGITWTFEGNSQIDPWRLGGKTLSNQDRSIFNITPIPADITSIEVNNGSATLTVNSITVVVSKDSNFSSSVFTQTYQYTSDGTITVTKPSGEDWTNCYVKVTYNVTTSGSSNQYVQLKSLVVNGTK